MGTQLDGQLPAHAFRPATVDRARWHEAPEPEAVNLLLDPGLAFGTGTHPTTSLCLQWLDGEPVQGLQVLDFGCGSGILAIAALLLGAERAVGTDIDVQALEASRENANRNGIYPARFPLYLPADLPGEPADVVVANIHAGPLVGLAEQITRLTRIGGRLALSASSPSRPRTCAPPMPAASTWNPPPPLDGWYA